MDGWTSGYLHSESVHCESWHFKPELTVTADDCCFNVNRPAVWIFPKPWTLTLKLAWSGMLQSQLYFSLYCISAIRSVYYQIIGAIIFKSSIWHDSTYFSLTVAFLDLSWPFVLPFSTHLLSKSEQFLTLITSRNSNVTVISLYRSKYVMSCSALMRCDYELN